MPSPQTMMESGQSASPRQSPGTRVKAELHSFLAQYPALFMPYMRLRGRNTDLLANRNTEIVIEGFPRSGNTFAVVAFRLAQGRDLRIAHHLHAPAQVIWAVRRQLPALVLIRRPVDAVLSLMIRDPGLSMSQGFRWYTRFYTALGPYRQGYVLSTFEEVVSDFGRAIARVNAKFGTTFEPFEHTEENVNESFRIIEAINVKRSARETVEEHTVARPSPVRTLAKEHLAKSLSETAIKPLVARANDAYDRLLGSHSLPVEGQQRTKSRTIR